MLRCSSRDHYVQDNTAESNHINNMSTYSHGQIAYYVSQTMVYNKYENKPRKQSTHIDSKI